MKTVWHPIGVVGRGGEPGRRRASTGLRARIAAGRLGDAPRPGADEALFPEVRLGPAAPAWPAAATTRTATTRMGLLRESAWVGEPRGPAGVPVPPARDRVRASTASGRGSSSRSPAGRGSSTRRRSSRSIAGPGSSSASGGRRWPAGSRRTCGSLKERAEDRTSTVPQRRVSAGPAPTATRSRPTATAPAARSRSPASAGMPRRSPAGSLLLLAIVFLVPDLTPPPTGPPPVELLLGRIVEFLPPGDDGTGAGRPRRDPRRASTRARSLDGYVQGPSGQQELPRYESATRSSSTPRPSRTRRSSPSPTCTGSRSWRCCSRSSRSP